jgi:predicted ferric reductase
VTVSLAGRAPRRASPGAAAAAAAGAGLVAVVAWWLRDLIGSPPVGGAAALSAGARLCGLAAGYLCLVQVLLAARLPALERGIPAGRLRLVHAVNGLVLLVVLTGHAGLAVASEATTSNAPFVGAAIGMIAFRPYLWSAALGMLLLFAAAVVTARPVRHRMCYGWWHVLHLSTYLAVVAGFAHQLLGADLRGTPGRAIWSALHLAVLAAMVWFRLLAGLWLSWRHDLRVSAVVAETPDVVSVWVTGRRIEALGAEPGQYLRWRIVRRGLWLHSHPFSLSAVPTADGLRFTVKAVGDYTGALMHLSPGPRLLVSGPAGALTERTRRGRNVLLLAGGIGIAPLRALLEGIDADRGDVTLIYRTDRADEVLFRSEIDEIAGRRGVDVHYLVSHPERGGEQDPIGPHQLVRLVPELFDYDAYVCGPPGMVATAVAALRTAGVQRRRIHTENLRI